MTQREIKAHYAKLRSNTKEDLTAMGFTRKNHWVYKTPNEHPKQITVDFATDSNNVAIVYGDYTKIHRISEVIQVVRGFLYGKE